MKNHSQTIEDACIAEEMVGIDELEDYAKTQRKEKRARTLFRIVYSFEVLADSPIHQEPFSLNSLAYEVMEGHSSGALLGIEVEKVSRKRMAALLLAQGSDPEFLLGDEE